MKPGDSIAGIELVEVLGTGGNTVVWRARASDGTEIALKVLKTKFAEHQRRMLLRLQTDSASKILSVLWKLAR